VFYYGGISVLNKVDGECYLNYFYWGYIKPESLRACLGASEMKGIEGAIISHYLKLNSGGF
jgi:hypothetical protein